MTKITWQLILIITYLTLSSSTNMTTTLACGFELKCSIIRSKSSDLALRDTFSDTAIQIPRFAAIEINDEIPWNENGKNILFITIVKLGNRRIFN